MKWARCQNPELSRWRLIYWPAGHGRFMTGIRFEPCGVQSFHPADVRERYCHFCHCWIDTEARDEVARDVPGGA